MNNRSSSKTDAHKAAAIVAATGGKLVGRTRMQKLAYLFEQTGLGEGFQFTYRHYGPYSEDLALATQNAEHLGLLVETERPATWGGTYSVFTTTQEEPDPVRKAFAEVACSADAVELELAATAAFLSEEGCDDPWQETARRKPDKAAEGRLEKARALYCLLTQVQTPKELPAIG